MTRKTLNLPDLPCNSNGWGPVDNLKLFNGMPYQSFNKNDRLGMVADWTGDTYADNRLLSMNSGPFGRH
ncbi:autophagy-related protein 2-like B [Sarcoptes scabiei]|nr:autophagy-related protein 2-like B [Sarcoptes scabiei]